MGERRTKNVLGESHGISTKEEQRTKEKNNADKINMTA